MKKIYYIGGSPCSGKSSVAEYLAYKHNLYYFKVDDFLEKYTNKGFLAKMPICTKQSQMSSEETWMRDPILQCKEEIQFYEEIFGFVRRDLEEIQEDRDIITEGAIFLPNLMKKQSIPWSRYLSITPSREFQINHYRQREWIHYVLDGCSNFEKAFNNWMDRDCLFANEVNLSCIDNDYFSIINDGQLELVTLIEMVAKHFRLED